MLNSEPFANVGPAILSLYVVNDYFYVHVWAITGEIMAPAKIAEEDLVKDFKDESLIAAFTSMFESFLNNVLKTLNDLQEENVELLS